MVRVNGRIRFGGKAARALAAVLGAWTLGAGAGRGEPAAPPELSISTVQAPLDYSAPARGAVAVR
jgi:hypothetical protein